jgi:hypothetical protein
MTTDEPLSFGVFKPVGHVVISFPTAAHADSAVQRLRGLDLGDDAVRRYTDVEMIRQIDHDRERASPLASIGQELNLVLAHRALAERGYHWLVVHAPDTQQAQRVAEIARACGAERAQAYGHFIIEELIQHDSDQAQVAESTDRGLDAQTASGLESDRAEAPAAPAPDSVREVDSKPDVPAAPTGQPRPGA